MEQINLARLLAAHDARQGQAVLTRNIGDGFLYSCNRYYAMIRDCALELGYAFDDAPSPHYREYLSLRLLGLPLLTQHKKIPYLDNVSVLRKICTVNRDIRLPVAFLRDNLHLNYLLHESCHCIGYSLIPDCAARSGLRELLCEAFANAVELLGRTAARAGEHAVSYSLNSYLDPDPAHEQAVRSAIRFHGVGATARFLCIAYLYANLLKVGIQKVSDISIWFERVVGRDLSRADRHQLVRLFRMSDELSTRFRMETTGAHFRVHHPKGALAHTRRTNPAGRVVADWITEHVHRVCSVVAKD